jgi:uncharacterized membrane protein YbhN (UPF0104 family)
MAAAAVRGRTPIGVRARRYLARVFSGVATLSTPSRLGATLLFSALAWAGQVATYHLTARALRFPVSVAASTTAVLAENVGFVFRATPGNVGVFQVVYALVMATFGLSKHAAVAVALLLQTLQIVPVTLLGIALAPEFVVRGRRLAAPGTTTEPTPTP